MDGFAQFLLRLSAASGSVEQLEQLIRQGADVNALHGGSTALCEACRNGHPRCVELLLAAGADHSIGEPVPGRSCSMTPLHLTVMNRRSASHTACVAALLQAGADPLATAGRTGLTPLHFAAADASLEAVRLICEAAHARVSMAQGI